MTLLSVSSRTSADIKDRGGNRAWLDTSGRRCASATSVDLGSGDVMRRPSRGARWLIVAGAAIVFSAFSITGAVAQPGPPESGVIYSCINNSAGTIKIVTVNENCNNGWTAVNWNGTGVQGPPGPAGPQGATGPAGSGRGAGSRRAAGSGRAGGRERRARRGRPGRPGRPGGSGRPRRSGRPPGSPGRRRLRWSGRPDGSGRPSGSRRPPGRAGPAG